MFEVVDQASELLQAAQGPGTEHAGQAVAKKRLKQAQLVGTGKGAQALQRLVANALLGRGCCPHKGGVVVVVGDQPQPGTQVANFGTIKKTLAARHLVGHLGFPERLLQHTGLVVGAVEHGKVSPFERAARAQASAQRLDARDHTLGFMFLVVAIDHPHRFAFTQLGKQGFGKQFGIGLDELVGGPKDGAG